MAEALLTLTTLRERGWTPALVRRFLGEPDKLAPNPAYRSAAPMRLYAEARVLAAEGEETFRHAQAIAQARASAARKTAQRRARDLLAAVERMEVEVVAVPLVDARRRAIRNYNARLLARERWDAEPAGEDSDPAFLERITVNFIRHRLTDYDTALEEVAGRVGVEAAVAAIRRRVYEAIAAAYPELAEECRRQLARRNGAG